MTEQLPPPQSPPPPAGYPPPFPAGAVFPGPTPAYGESSAGEFAAKSPYVRWPTRVLAWIIDYIPYFLILSIGSAYFVTTALQQVTVCVTDTSEFNLGDFCARGNQGATTGGWIALAVSFLVGFVYLLWNCGYRQGTTGSSVGKAILKVKLVGETTGQPIGFAVAALREIEWLVIYLAGGLLWLISVLFPLWDDKAQTLVDKVFKAVCLPV